MINAKQRLAALLCIVLSALAPASADEQRTFVSTAPLETLVFFPSFSAPATTLSLNDSRISAETSGRIDRIAVQMGEEVPAGALLATLDCRDNILRRRQAEASLESARSRVALARKQLLRTQSLRKERNISEELYNQREADLSTSRADLQAQSAALDKARLDEARCSIKAPFGGLIMKRLASEGEWINPGQPLVQLLDNRRLEVSAQLPLDRVDSLASAPGITIETNHSSHPLLLRRVVPAVGSRGRNREVRLTFTDTTALPGSTGRLKWTSATPYLPADIPVRRDGRLGLFLLEQDMARFHVLEGALEGQPARVDLPAESLLIIEGRQSLSDDQPVAVRP
ncbi:MAG: efflux RND transporter periplasmic adaptor subunit [Sedimenticola sp.]